MKSLTSSFSHPYNEGEVAGHEGAYLTVPAFDLGTFCERCESCPITLLERITRFQQFFPLSETGILTEIGKEGLYGGEPLGSSDTTG